MAPLGGLEDLPGFKASGADLDPPNGTADKCAHALKIRFEAPPGPVVSVRDAIPKLRPFAADFTTFRH